MIQKLTISLALPLLIGFVWVVTNPVTIPPAQAKIQVNERLIIRGPAAILAGQPVRADSSQASPQAITITLYLPTIVKNYCGSALSFNESLGYGLNKIGAVAAWQVCRQGQGIIIAIVDTGIDLDHPDLQANLVTGQSFVAGTVSPDDDNGHGTHVAGIAAGVNNNGGIIGVAPGASLMPVKVLNAQASGSAFAVAAGIRWAADHGAKVINLSLGNSFSSATLKDAIDYAYNRGTVLAASAGNCGDSAFAFNGCSFQDQPSYPAAYANVIAVASTDINDNQSSFSNEGSYIEVAAPGSSIYSSFPPGGYAILSGTSMASPHVAGLAALIWSNRSDLTNQAVRAQIRNTATDLGTPGWDTQFGYGRINAVAAVNTLQTNATTTAAAVLSDEVRVSSAGSFVPGEVLLKLRPGRNVINVLDLAELGSTKVKVAGQISQLGIHKLAVPPGQEQVLISKLRTMSGVAYAELNYTVKAQ